MRILFLYNKESKGLKASELIEWLKGIGEEVIPCTDKFDYDYVAKIDPEIIVSFGYKHILNKDVLKYPKKGCINLHISYLPYNRGYDPNIWSFLENTPKGVTIHYMDEGIDSGDILVQKEIVFDESKETLETTYDALQKSIVQLFKENWIKIISGKIEPRKQIGNGTIHYKADQFKFMHLIKEKGWKTPVKDIAGIYAKLERDKSGR